SCAVKGELTSLWEMVTSSGPVVSNDPGTTNSPSSNSHSYSTRVGPFTRMTPWMWTAGPEPGVPQTDVSKLGRSSRILTVTGVHSTRTSSVFDRAVFGERISIHRWTVPVAVTCSGSVT